MQSDGVVSTDDSGNARPTQTGFEFFDGVPSTQHTGVPHSAGTTSASDSVDGQYNLALYLASLASSGAGYNMPLNGPGNFGGLGSEINNPSFDWLMGGGAAGMHGGPEYDGGLLGGGGQNIGLEQQQQQQQASTFQHAAPNPPGNLVSQGLAMFAQAGLPQVQMDQAASFPSSTYSNWYPS